MKKFLLEEVFNCESKDSRWEIVNNNITGCEDIGFIPSNTVTLHYVPEDGYSEKDVKITMPTEHFEDLVSFMKNFK